MNTANLDSRFYESHWFKFVLEMGSDIFNMKTNKIQNQTEKSTNLTLTTAPGDAITGDIRLETWFILTMTGFIERLACDHCFFPFLCPLWQPNKTERVQDVSENQEAKRLIVNDQSMWLVSLALSIIFVLRARICLHNDTIWMVTIACVKRSRWIAQPVILTNIKYVLFLFLLDFVSLSFRRRSIIMIIKTMSSILWYGQPHLFSQSNTLIPTLFTLHEHDSINNYEFNEIRNHIKATFSHCAHRS